MKLLSEFANEIGISRQAVFKAGQRGKFQTHKMNGKLCVDENDKDVIEYINNIIDKKNGQSCEPKKVEKSECRQNKIQKNIDKKEVVIQKNEIPEYLKNIADSGELSFNQLVNLSKVEIDKIKIYEQIKQIRTKTEHSRKELVSRKLIKIIFGKLYDIDINEFLMLKNKIVPDLAGLFGCTDSEKMIEAEKKIDEECWKILKHIKIEIDKFLEKCNIDEL